MSKQACRTSILLQRFPKLLPDIVERMDLLNGLIVERKDIMRLDIRRLILLKQGKLVSNVEDAIKNRLFLGVEGRVYSWRVTHDCGRVEERWRMLRSLLRSNQILKSSLGQDCKRHRQSSKTIIWRGFNMTKTPKAMDRLGAG